MSTRMFAAIGLLAIAGSMGACRVGPAYHSPSVATPPAFRGADATQTASKSLGDEECWAVFGDTQLRQLIRKAIAQNFDVQLAAERVVQAGAQLGIVQADQRPVASAAGSLTSQRLAKEEMGFNPDPVMVNLGRLGGSAAWNLDFWGRYRMATEAARAQLLASEWAQRAVLATVVSDVATSYFQLRSLDMELDIAKQTLSTRQESLLLTRKLEAGGSASMLDVREAEQLVFAARAQITDLERQIEQQEDTICTLLGEAPHEIARGLTIDQQPRLPVVPAGLPSELLQRRPDIREAEAMLVAANAEIGVARAAYFPQISLTGSLGTDTNALSRLFTGSSYAWNYGPAVSVPIFDAHRIRNNIKVNESVQRQALITYQKTIATAFRDVSMSLVAYRKYRDFREQQEKIVQAAAAALNLAKLRYEHGQSSYLDVLTNDRALLAAQFDVTATKQNELLTLVRLYNVLGGGWK